MELSADSDDVSDDVSRHSVTGTDNMPRSRPFNLGSSRDLVHVVDGGDGWGSQRRALPSNNVQMTTSADDDSDDGESYHRVVVICIHNLSNLHTFTVLLSSFEMEYM